MGQGLCCCNSRTKSKYGEDYEEKGEEFAHALNFDSSILKPIVHQDPVNALVAIPIDATKGGDQVPLVVSAGETGTIFVHDVIHGKVHHTWYGHQSGVNALAVAESNNVEMGSEGDNIGHSKFVFSGSRDCTIRQWKIEKDSNTSLQVLSGHQFTITGLTCDQKGEKVISGSRDCTVRLWDSTKGQQILSSHIPRNLVTCCRWICGSDSEVLQTGEDLRIRIWDTRSFASPAVVLEDNVNIPLSCDVSEDGLLFSACCNGFDGSGCEVKLYDKRTLKPLHVLRGHNQAVYSCVFVRVEDQNFLVSGSKDAEIRIWDVNSGQCTHHAKIHDSGCIYSLASTNDRCVSFYTGCHQGPVSAYKINTNGKTEALSRTSN